MNSLWRKTWWILSPLLAAVAYRGVVGFDFIGDALFLIPENTYMRDPGGAWDQVIHNYFWSSSGNIIPYWRPWTKLSWFLEYQLFGPSPAGFMVIQVLWHALASLGVQRLARLLGASRHAALAGGMIFALHPVAVAPVSMLMARSDVVAACGLVWCMVGWVGWCRGGRWPNLLLLAAALLLALASKEAAIITPLVMAGWVLVDGGSPRRWRRAALPLAAAVALAAAYLATRGALLTADAAGLESVRTVLDPLRIWACLAKYLQNLFPLWLTSGVRDVTPAEAASGPFILGGLLTLASALALALWAGIGRRWQILWLLCWAGLAMGPVMVTAEIHVPAAQGKFPMADRWLYHALAPAAVIWALLLHHAEVFTRGQTLARFMRPAAGVIMVVWGLVILLNSGPATAEFGSVDGMLDNEDRAYYHATPEPFRTAEDVCRFLDRQVVRALRGGDLEAVVQQVEQAVSRCGQSPERRHWLLSALVSRGKYAEAAPVARALIQQPPADRRGYGEVARLAGVTLRRTGQPAQAEALLRTAIKLGQRGCNLLVELAEAQNAQGKRSLAARQLAQAFRCGGGKDASLLLAGATMALQGGDGATAAELLKVARALKLSPDQAAQAAWLTQKLQARPGAPGIAPPQP